MQPIISKTDVLLLFLQDELSIDDFTRHSQSFKFVKKSLANSNHVAFPSVNVKDETVLDYIKDIRKINILDIPLGSDIDAESLIKQLEHNVLNVVVVNLEPLRDGNMESKEIILKRNDETMDSTTKKLLKLSTRITSLYTSEDLSMDIQNILINEELDNSHNIKSRHILEDDKKVEEKSDPKVLRSNCVLMYLSGLKVGITKKDNFTDVLDVVNNSTIEGTCVEHVSYQLVVTLNEGKGLISSDFKLKINLVNSNGTGEWMCDSIEAKGKIDGKEKNSSFSCGNHKIPWTGTTSNTIISPIQYSFACNDMEFSDGNFTVIFNGLQIQPTLNAITSEFKDAYHCEGFFTLEILTGLFVGALLIASLYLGTMMMMNIQTQDRFDDPKGKTIQVAAQE